jgi:hypothetical protein
VPPPPSASRLALAPLAVPLLDAALELGLLRAGSPGWAAALASRARESVASTTTLLAYAAAFAAGLPFVLALRSRGRLTAAPVVFAAAAAGATVALAAVALLARAGVAFRGVGHRSTWLLVPLASALAAAVVAAAFCVVAGVPVRRAPERRDPRVPGEPASRVLGSSRAG